MRAEMEGVNGDLHQLYETYFNDVYHYLLFFTNSKNDAEDLTQETFIKVFKNYEKFQKKSSFKTWIFSIAKNIAMDHFQKRKTLTILPDLFSRMTLIDKERTEDYFDKMEDWERLQHALLK
jgi:RNA polymerase sigma-70 factor (ECF subfamily)